MHSAQECKHPVGSSLMFPVASELGIAFCMKQALIHVCVNDKEHNVLTVASNSESSIKHRITNQYGSDIVEHSAFGE